MAVPRSRPGLTRAASVQTASVACRSLCDPCEHLLLLGKQPLHPIDYCAHAGGAAQIASKCISIDEARSATGCPVSLICRCTQRAGS